MKTALTTVALVAVLAGAGFAVNHFVFPAPADAAAAEANAEARCDSAAVAPLASDLDALRVQLAQAEARADSLGRIVARRADAADNLQAGAADLASTLSKMEDDNLKGVVQRLDGRSFVRLYEAASSRNRGRLLAALTPVQAAAFVRHQLPGSDSAPASSPAPASGSASTGGAAPADSTTTTG